MIYVNLLLHKICPDSIPALYMFTVAKPYTYIHPLMYCVTLTGLSNGDIMLAIHSWKSRSLYIDSLLSRACLFYDIYSQLVICIIVYTFIFVSRRHLIHLVVILWLNLFIACNNFVFLDNFILVWLVSIK